MVKTNARYRGKIIAQKSWFVITVPARYVRDGHVSAGKEYYVTISESGYNGNGAAQ